MTIHELLSSVPFDDLLEAMHRIRFWKYAIKNDADYKEALDYITHIEPYPEKGSVDFAIIPRERWHETDGLVIIAGNIRTEASANVSIGWSNVSKNCDALTI